MLGLVGRIVVGLRREAAVGAEEHRIGFVEDMVMLIGGRMSRSNLVLLRRMTVVGGEVRRIGEVVVLDRRIEELDCDMGMVDVEVVRMLVVLRRIVVVVRHTEVDLDCSLHTADGHHHRSSRCYS